MPPLLFAPLLFAPLLFVVALQDGPPVAVPNPPAGGDAVQESAVPEEPAPAEPAEPAVVEPDDARWVGPLRAAYPFNGHDLTGWVPLAVPPWSLDGPRGANLWTVGVSAPKPDDPRELVVGPVGAGDPPELVTPGEGADLATAERFGDMRVSLEYLLPTGSNAGVIPHGRYELQLLDPAHRQAAIQQKDLEKGRVPGPRHPKGHLSAYGFAAPTELPELPAGQWHTLSFRFVAPRFDAEGTKTADARFERITVDGVEALPVAALPGSTGKRDRGAETAVGPLVLQGDHGPVAFRNLKIEVPADAPDAPAPDAPASDAPAADAPETPDAAN